MSKKTTRNVAIGAALAGVAGYVAGILTAPKSGKETRKDIHDAANKAMHEAELQLKKLHSELNELIATGKGRLNDAKDTAKTELSKILAQAEVAKEKARVILSAIHEGDADDKDLKKAIDEVKKASAHLRDYLEKSKNDK